ncbi:MAG: hypothetical protein V4598_05950 [Bdellovibrionota bacterium]
MQTTHHPPLSEISIDVLLFMGTIGSIFLFGLAALPWVQVEYLN